MMGFACQAGMIIAMRAPAVILVHESAPHWGPVLQREFLDSTEIEVRLAPHLADLTQKLHQEEVIGCVVALEASIPDALLDVLRLHTNRLSVFLLAPLLPADVEWQLRDLGAASILNSLIPVSQFVRILHQRLQSQLMREA